MLFDSADHAEVHLRGDIETSGYAACAEAELALGAAEDLRLGYVAMTRARDHLVVSLHRSAPTGRGRSSLAELVASRLEDLAGLYEDGSGVLSGLAGERRRRRPPQPPAPEGPAATESALAAWHAAREMLQRRCARRTSMAATGLAELAVRADWSGPARETASDDAPADQIRWGARRAATSLGRAVHGALQRVDLGGGALDAIVADEAFEEGCAERSSEVRDLVLSALAAPTVVAAAAAPRCWRELPVTVPVDGGILEGIVDLCFAEDDHLVVVDYKTDKLASADEAPGAARRYRLQAGAYALALRSALALPVDRIVLVFLAPPGGAVEYVIDDPDEAAAEAAAELATAMA